MKLIIDKPYRNIDKFAVVNNLWLLQDGYIDQAGSISKRPGLKLFFDLSIIDKKYASFPVDCLYWFSEQSMLIAACGGDLISITDINLTNSILGTNLLNTGVKCTFTKTSDSANSLAPTVFIANGKCAYTTGGSASSLSGSNIPTAISHVVSNDTYLITNDINMPTSWKTSDVGTPKVWSNAYTYSKQSKTDKIQGIAENKGQIMVYGKDSIEFFYDTGLAIPYQKIDGALVEMGTVNPYAIGKFNNDVYFLNTNRQLIALMGLSYSPQIVSDSYSKRIEEFTSINDVDFEVVSSSGGRNFILMNFNDAKTTLVYDITQQCFYEWGYWDTTTAQYKQFQGHCFAYSPDWNLNLMGDRESGKIYIFDPNYTSDNGNPIRTEVITGNYDFGSIEQEKSLNNVFFNFRRGDGLATQPYTSPKAYFQYRINNNLVWNIQNEIDLGAAGQTVLLDSQISGGAFRTIQFRFLHMDDSRFVLNGVYIDV